MDDIDEAAAVLVSAAARGGEFSVFVRDQRSGDGRARLIYVNGVPPVEVAKLLRDAAETIEDGDFSSEVRQAH